MAHENKIIIMDDDDDYANFIFDVVKKFNPNCIITNNSNNFIQVLDDNVSLVFLDLNIPGLDGIDLLKFIQKQKIRCNIILMSGVEDRIMESAEAFAKSINLAVVGRFQKTIRLAELENLLANIIAPKAQTIETLPQSKSELIIPKDLLVSAIQHDDFIPYYQPQIDIKTNKFHGVEVINTWLNKKNQVIFPEQFVAQAESFGLIDEISWHIFKKAIKEIQYIQDKMHAQFKIALNLSSRTLKDINFPKQFLKMIEESTISPDKIVLEISESGITKELSNTLEAFTRLRLHHIQLSIDNFGTGHEMMQQLKLIPANELKIDKSFIHNMLSENSARVTVKKVIEIGHELGMKVVAEGVQNVEQLEFLQTHHCDVAQGDYFSKPILFANFHDWINQNYPI